MAMGPRPSASAARRCPLSLRAVLRPVRLEDADELYALVERNRDHLRSWMPWADQGREATVAFLHETTAAPIVQQAIVDGEGRIVGCCGLHHLDERNRSAAIGYWISAHAQGTGLMAAAVREQLDQAFGPHGLNRVELRTAPGNERSRALAERLGFTEEALLREAERWPDGYRDLVVYAMLASDWRS